MTQKQKSKQRIEFVIKVGPELMSIIQEQMNKIKEVTYGVDKSSVWIAGEILAKKLKGET